MTTVKSNCNLVHVGLAAFVIHEGAFLIQKRTGAHGAETWAPPGGKLDFGETPQEGIAREVREETNVVITQPESIGFTNDFFIKEGLHFITLWFIANKKSGEFTIAEPEKCLEQKMVTLDTIPTNLFMPTAQILTDDYAYSRLRMELERQ